MPQLAIAPSFLDDFSRLDRSVQAATLSVMHDFISGERPQLDSPSAPDDTDARVLSIGPEWSGVVVPTSEDVYCLLAVRHHDDAMAYARGWRPTQDPALDVVAVPPPPRAEDAAPHITAPSELVRALEGPFAEWRRTLHPEHRRLAEAEFAGSVRVSGGPGTGTQVLALHRAAFLAAQDSARFALDDRTAVLLATARRVHAQALSHHLDRLITDPGVRARVDVVTMDSLARGVVGERTRTVPQTLTAEELSASWQAAAWADGLPYSGRFLVDEWEQVILARNLTDLPSYIRCDRNGRLRHLAPEYRPHVWRAIQRYSSALRAQQQWFPPQLAAEAARLLGRSGPRYRHIVVDAVHELHPAQLRVLRAAVPEGPDDLFLTGDPAQQLYDPRVSLASIGIRVRGRAHVLRTHYRTTQEIRRFASGILHPDPPPGLRRPPAVGPAPQPRLAVAPEPAEAMLRGQRPTMYRAVNRAEEYAQVVARVRSWLDAGVAAAAVAVAGRNHWIVRRLAKELQATGIATAPMDAVDDDSAVRVDTLHRLGGQEFRCVAVVGMSEPLLPPKAAVGDASGDPAALAQLNQAERSLLYAACMSARDNLYISYVDTPSRLLTEAVDQLRASA